VAISIIKLCARCKQELSKESFSPDTRAKDLLQSTCRLCVNKSRRDKYQLNIDEARNKRKYYYQRNTNSILSINAKSREKNKSKIVEKKRIAYFKNKSNPAFIEKLKNYCALNKQRKRIYDIEYRKLNSEKLAEKERKWKLANPDKVKLIKKIYKYKRRSLEKVGDATSLIHSWLVLQKKICYWCNKNCDSDYHIDHYVPLAKGGSHKIDNLVISCPTCNLTKNAKDPYEYALSIGKLF
jgi:5-methylcytosine-specific restriction endonuclease McrA